MINYLGLYVYPLHANTTSILDLMQPGMNYDFSNWTRTTKLQGGYWNGTFELVGDYFTLLNYFYTMLGYCVREKLGGNTTWEGMIYELDIETEGGSSRRRSLDLMTNYVRYKYTDTEGEIKTGTPVSSANSVTKFGQKEEYAYGDNISATEALAMANVLLKVKGWPYARTLSMRPPEEELPSVMGRKTARLIGTVCGYAFTANWQYVTTGDGTDDDIDDWIQEIVVAHCPYLQLGQISANTMQTEKTVADADERAWDVIMGLVARGDSTYQPYRAWVGPDRCFNYWPISVTPSYYWLNGDLSSSTSAYIAVNPWYINPGVVRDMEFPGAISLPSDSWLTDARDTLVTEVEVDHQGNYTLKSDDFDDESEIRAAQLDYLYRGEDEDDDEANRGNKNWKYGLHVSVWGKLSKGEQKKRKAYWQSKPLRERVRERFANLSTFRAWQKKGKGTTSYEQWFKKYGKVGGGLPEKEGRIPIDAQGRAKSKEDSDGLAGRKP